MEQHYAICKTFLRKIDYNMPNPEEFIVGARNKGIVKKSTHIDVKVSNTKEAFFYLVDVFVYVKEGKKKNELNMSLVYSSLISVLDHSLNEEEIVNMLKAEVPKEVFGNIRELVTRLTGASGYSPVVLDDYDSKGKNITGEDNPILDNDVEPPLGYEWIIHKILSVEDGAGATFLETFTHAFGTSWKKYKDSLFYRYYYRFMQPINYMHPNFDRCEADFWDLFFQLVMGESDEVIIEKGNNDLPEIVFSIEGFKDQRITNMSLEEIKELTFELATKAFASTMVSLCSIKYNDEYGETLSSKQPPLIAEIHKLFNYSEERMSEDDISTTKLICEHIKRYDDLTFEYRLFSE